MCLEARSKPVLWLLRRWAINIFGLTTSFQVRIMLHADNMIAALCTLYTWLPFCGTGSALKSGRKPKQSLNAGRKKCLKSHRDVLLHEPPYLSESCSFLDENKTGGCLANERRELWNASQSLLFSPAWGFESCRVFFRLMFWFGFGIKYWSGRNGATQIHAALFSIKCDVL